jgi:hypothetical protein
MQMIVNRTRPIKGEHLSIALRNLRRLYAITKYFMFFGIDDSANIQIIYEGKMNIFLLL